MIGNSALRAGIGILFAILVWLSLYVASLESFSADDFAFLYLGQHSASGLPEPARRRVRLQSGPRRRLYT